MTDIASPPVQHNPRRSNFILRALIDEMLDQVRDLDRHSPSMSDEEREAAERSLEALMTRVRRAAMKGPLP
ncbi:MAG: hypothetical protein HYV19_05415 [Gemmatimonadetes bacterium]|nr:hypothetical protein [Gemmatimonadota bacterium]